MQKKSLVEMGKKGVAVCRLRERRGGEVREGGRGRGRRRDEK